MQRDTGRVWIVSTSGRALAALARRSAMPAVVFDAYADEDTRRLALQCHRVRARGHALDADALLAALDAAAASRRGAGIIYGSGLEAQPEVLERLKDYGCVYGNEAQVLRTLNSPGRFTALLQRLGIPHPPTRLAPPMDPRGWLRKQAGGCGGTHVHPCDGTPAPEEGGYFQRHVAGASMSVLFLADGARARVLGWNRIWAAGSAGQPFRYGGAVNRAGLGARQRDAVCAHVESLTRSLGLVGLNGLDFIATPGGVQVLELNPRPTATVELHDADFAPGLIRLHVDACRAGRLPACSAAPGTVRAHAIVYSPRAVVVAHGMRWPSWCADLPAAGSRIPKDAPLCSVQAAAPTVSGAHELLRGRTQQIEQWFRGVRKSA